MSILGGLVLLLVIAAPLAWVTSEFCASRAVRLTLGSVAILMSFGVAFLAGAMERLNSNAWFGHASKKLVDAAVIGLEAGRGDRVLQSFKHLQAAYTPSYENRAGYDTLVEQAVAEMGAGERENR